MARLLKKQAPASIREFGKLGFIGTQKMDRSIIISSIFTAERIEVKDDIPITEIEHYRNENSISWINVVGLHDLDLIREIGALFELHPMVIDKITNTGDRAGFEDYDDYAVITLKQMHLNQAELTVDTEHILFILFKNILITFQENLKDPFTPIRERLQIETSRIRKTKTDYLALSLVRAIINDYSSTVEYIGSKIENLEREIFSQTNRDTLEELNIFNTEIGYLNKILRPAKEAVLNLCRSDSELIDQTKSQFLINHLSDNIQIVADAGEYYRLMLHDQLNIYHTNVSNRLNEMFRVLTIFSVIFVPLTFIAGIYGMNFEIIPELKYPYGYYVVWLVMVLLATVMLVYFKRKKWL